MMRKMIFRCAMLVVLWLSIGRAGMQVQAQALPLPRVFPYQAGYWEEAMLSTLTLEEKIGQLFMVAAYSTPGANTARIEELITKYKIGGLIFMQGTPERQNELLLRYQSLSPLPLLIGADYEWGLSMRLDSTLMLPKNMTLGSVNDNDLLYRFGQELARECRSVGVHVNFAPTVDVNNNKNNPVIGFRSFGDDKYAVSNKGILVSKGLQDGGVFACAKHFPGHGDTGVDSHHDLPRLRFDRKRLDSLEIYPFSRLADNGVHSIMVAHLFVPALDSAKNTPATLSKKIVQKTLRDSLGFRGLIFTDALNMGGVTRFFPAGEIEVRALEAGNDVLLFPENIPLAIESIKKAIQKGRLSEKEIDQKVLRILTAKGWLCVDRPMEIKPKEVKKVIFSEEAVSLQEQLYRDAITLIKNDGMLLPLRGLERKKIACIQMGRISPSPFYQGLEKYASVDLFPLSKEASMAEMENLVNNLKGKYTTVIVGMFDLSKYASKRYGLTQSMVELMNQLARVSELQTTLVLFGNPYLLAHFGTEQATLLAHEEEPAAQTAAAEVIFGAYPPKGVSPVRLPGKFWEKPMYAYDADLLGFGRPDQVQLDAQALSRIDTIADYYIKQKAMPGCAVLVARGNRIVYTKGFGHPEYNGSEKVNPYKTVYDLASVTKVMATTLAVMKLYDQGRLDVNATISRYLPEVQAPLGNLKLHQLLQHVSGLPPYIPFHEKTVKKFKHDPTVFASSKSDSFPIAIAPNLYLSHKYPAHVWEQIIHLKPHERPKPVYSDINMIIMAKVVERIAGLSMDSFLIHSFYRPMGLNHTSFNPCDKGWTIAPSEDDRKFRFSRLQGYVNDETCALLGGVSGHAGLFSNVYDLAKLLFMLKNGGRYGGTQYLSPSTINAFTQKYSNVSRRGLGWDKPETNPSLPNPTPERASLKTFGHIGFTGTAAWVDPENDFIYIVLANRTFPDRDNTLYTRAGVRVKMMDAIYESLQKYQEKRFVPYENID